MRSPQHGSTTDYETIGLLSTNEKIKDQYVIHAVEYLHWILYIVSWTILFVFLLLFINEFVDHAIPIWAIFLVLWIGHVLLLVVAGSSIQLVLDSMTSDGDEERTTALWHQINERRIPLIQYLMYNLAWVLWTSMILWIFEILVFLSTMSLVEPYDCLVPIYIVSGLAILTAFVCRSSALSVTITWILILTTVALIHTKLLYPDRIAYSDIFIPVYILLAYWIALCFYTVLLHAIDVYRLKTYQIEIIMLYIVSFTLFIVAALGLEGYLQGDSDPMIPGGLSVVYVALLVGSGFFFLGLVLNVNACITAVIARMGADKPKPLSLSEVGGGWTVVESAFYDSTLLVGEIEINSHIKNSNMMSMNNQRGNGVDDKDMTDAAKQQHCGQAFFNVIFCHVLGIPRTNASQTSSSLSSSSSPP